MALLMGNWSCFTLLIKLFHPIYNSGKITIIPKPELRGLWEDSLSITTIWGNSLGGLVAIICPAKMAQQLVDVFFSR